jgi:hypothetical protein
MPAAGSLPVALTLPLHDPGGTLAPLLVEAAADFDQVFAARTVVVSAATPAAVRDTLRVAGYHVFEQLRPGVGTARRDALGAALADATGWALLCDADRALWWLRHWPHELAEVVERIPEHDLLVLGRTRRAFATHPPEQRETEQLSNTAVSLLWGAPIDITAAARGVSARAARLLQRQSHAPGWGTDGEWPLLARAAGLRVGYLATEGLEYETAIVHQADADAVWQTRRSADARVWRARTATALEIIDAALAVAAAGSAEAAAGG